MGYGLWQRQFGGRPELVGQSVVFNGRPHTVIGIMPPEFQFPSVENFGLRTRFQIITNRIGVRPLLLSSVD
jgi:hypothetical protein